MLPVAQDSARLLDGIMSLPKCQSLSLDYWGSLTLGTPSSLGVLLHPTYSIIVSPPSSLNIKIEKLKVRDYLKATTWTNHYDQPMKDSEFFGSDCIRGHCILGIFTNAISVLSYLKGCISSKIVCTLVTFTSLIPASQYLKVVSHPRNCVYAFLLLALYKLEVSAVIILVQKFQKSVQTLLINNCKHFSHFLQMVVPLLCHGFTLKNLKPLLDRYEIWHQNPTRNQPG